MKKFILLFILISGLGFGQTPPQIKMDMPTQQFTVVKSSFTDYIVVEVKGKTSKQLYDNALSWINDTYRSPKDVIKNLVPNETLRFEGSANDMFCSTDTNCHNGIYQIEISFKEGKYKFDVLEIRTFYNRQWYITGFGKGNISDDRVYFHGIDEVPKYFNNLNESLLKYEKGQKSKNNDW